MNHTYTKPLMNIPGTIYLLHFDRPYEHARHYIGFTEGPVEDRIALHLRGQGSPLVRAAVESGIEVSLAVTYQGTRAWERRFKRRKNTSHICPVCRANGRKS